MQIMVGDSRLEQVATRVSDARAKETEREEQQSLVQNREEKAKMASSDGVVLEVSKADSYVKQNATKKVEQTEVSDKKQQKEQLQKQQKEQQMTAVTEQRQILENINIT